MYGRTKAIDAHRESFEKLKNGVIRISNPPPIKTLHKDVWPVTLEAKDGKKLVIGTQVSNALTTSSTRLDEKRMVCIGGMTSHFTLDTMASSLACKTFINTNSLKAAKAKIEDTLKRCVTNNGIIVHQLRQVRTHFHQLSAYTLCRASGPITANHTCHPYTLFTLIENDRGRGPLSSIFYTIANEVLSNGASAQLNKGIITKCIKKTTGKEIQEIFNSIHSLYNDSDKGVTIISNGSLNKQLQSLTHMLIPAIVTANTLVENQVINVFQILG